MNKLFYAVFSIVIMCITAACGKNYEDLLPPVSVPSETQNTTENTGSETSAKKEENILSIEITVDEKTFSAELYDNETAEKFAEMLPLTLDMSELNENEKYYYLETDLPQNSSVPSGIKSGDIMLYGSSCLVLFYDSFSTSYSYTPIGRIDNAEGLAEALGKGGITVTFDKS